MKYLILSTLILLMGCNDKQDVTLTINNYEKLGLN